MSQSQTFTICDFLTDDNKEYEIEIEQFMVCNDQKCFIFYKFKDGRVFDSIGQRKEMFQYIRENHTPKNNS